MKHKSLYLIYTVRGAFLISLVLVVFSFKSSFVNTQHLAYSFDPRITNPIVKEIKHAVNDLVKEKASPESIWNHLIAHWSVVSTVAIASTMPKTLHVDVNARDPWVRVNEKKILTKDGTLVDQLQFVSSAYDSLPCIQIPHSMEIERTASESFVAIVSKCYSLLSFYDLVFHNDTNIVLYNKQDRRFAIVCAATQLPDQVTIERCNRIRQDLELRGKFTERLSRVWLVDTRFSNQIIVSTDHGGEVYGAYCV